MTDDNVFFRPLILESLTFVFLVFPEISWMWRLWTSQTRHVCSCVPPSVRRTWLICLNLTEGTNQRPLFPSRRLVVNTINRTQQFSTSWMMEYVCTCVNVRFGFYRVCFYKVLKLSATLSLIGVNTTPMFVFAQFASVQLFFCRRMHFLSAEWDVDTYCTRVDD